jgi:23S rRNA pseudouridine1911/1915/1917 synthase
MSITKVDNGSSRQIELTATEPGERIDLYISNNSVLNRSRVQKLIKEGLVLVNAAVIKPNYKVKVGDCIEIQIPPAAELTVEPEQINLDIIYEDDDIIVLNKQKGLVVHPAAGNYSGTLVNALLDHCGDSLSGINGVIRPGIVHRLDKDTSGVLVVAKNDLAHLNLAEQIKHKTVAREYLALVHGVISEPRGVIEAPVGRHAVLRKKMAVTDKGRPAITHYQVLERFRQYTCVKANLETGRTHQIRVHLAYIGHPVVGDPVYGPRKIHFSLSGQLLHAHKLGFIHPRTKIFKEFTSPLPDYFAEILEQLRA